MIKRSLVLLAHGSRNPHWRQPFDEIIHDLQQNVGNASICLAHLQMCEPLLPSALETLVAQGSDYIQILPLLMGGGNHTAEQIPAEVAAVRAKHPNVVIEVLPPIGNHPRFKAMLRDLVAEVL